MNTRLPVLFIIIITVAMDSIGVGLMMPVMPDLIREITGQSVSEAAVWGGMMAFTYAGMQFLFGPTIGNLSDRFGRRPVLLASLVVMSLSYLTFARAQVIWLLVVTRAIAGITGATFATANAYMADITPAEKRAASFGMVGAAFGVGFIIGPAIGGMLGQLGPRAPFYAAALVAALNALFGGIFLPETLAQDKRRPFVLERCNPFKALLRLRRVPGIGGLALVFFLFTIGQNVYASIWPYYTEAQFGFDAGMKGISLAIFGLFMILVQGGLIRAVIPRFGEANTARASLALNVLVLTITGFISNTVLLFVFMPFMALGILASPAIKGMMSQATSAANQGELQGVLASVQALAMIIAPALMTWLFRVFTSADAPVHLPGAPFLAAAALCATALAILMVLRARPQP
jgi:DHA1 family tetracycline resistance protein-like MFS transporter